MSKVPDKADAVCGSDGITYSNQCLFKHYKCITGVVVNKVHNGPCIGEEHFKTDDNQFNGPLVKDRSAAEFHTIALSNVDLNLDCANNCGASASKQTFSLGIIK